MSSGGLFEISYWDRAKMKVLFRQKLADIDLAYVGDALLLEPQISTRVFQRDTE